MGPFLIFMVVTIGVLSLSLVAIVVWNSSDERRRCDILVTAAYRHMRDQVLSLLESLSGDETHEGIRWRGDDGEMYITGSDVITRWVAVVVPVTGTRAEPLAMIERYEFGLGDSAPVLRTVGMLELSSMEQLWSLVPPRPTSRQLKAEQAAGGREFVEANETELQMLLETLRREERRIAR